MTNHMDQVTSAEAFMLPSSSLSLAALALAASCSWWLPEQDTLCYGAGKALVGVCHAYEAAAEARELEVALERDEPVCAAEPSCSACPACPDFPVPAAPLTIGGTTAVGIIGGAVAVGWCIGRRRPAPLRRPLRPVLIQLPQ